MAGPLAALFTSRSRWFDLGVFAVGVCSWSSGRRSGCSGTGVQMDGLALVCVPLIVIIAKFPMVLDSGEGGIEVGFDSSVLMFLLCTLRRRYDAAADLVARRAGHPDHHRQAADGQAVQRRRRDPRRRRRRGGRVPGPRPERRGHAPRAARRGAGGGAATSPPTTSLSAVSVAIETETPVRGHLCSAARSSRSPASCPSTPWATSAPWSRSNLEWWTLLLLAVPLVTLLVATRAVDARPGERPPAQRALRRGGAGPDAVRHPPGRRRAHRRRPPAAADQAGGGPGARRPARHEIGAQLRDGQRDSWIVAPGQHRARSTTTADQQALEAMVAVSSDAFARLRLTEDMTHLARHDLLTNLPNRGLLLDRVEHALQMSRRRGNRIALLFVDLDGFKPVNDRFGHAAGDAVLIDVAQRLSELRAAERHRGPARRRRVRAAARGRHPPEVSTACDRILASLAAGRPRRRPPARAVARAIGVAFGDSSETAESMLRNADLAMYEAKARGKNQWVEYERAIGRSRLQRLELVESLRASVARRRPHPRLPARRARLHRLHHRGRGAGALEVQRGRRTPGRVHPGRRGDRPGRRPRRRGARPGRPRRRGHRARPPAATSTSA